MANIGYCSENIVTLPEIDECYWCDLLLPVAVWVETNREVPGIRDRFRSFSNILRKRMYDHKARPPDSDHASQTPRSR